MIIVSCCAPYGVGGLGRTLADVEAAARARGVASHVYASAVGGGAALGNALTCVAPRWPRFLCRIPPIRFDPARQLDLTFAAFDRRVAGRLSSAPEAVVAFSGHALNTFRRAGSLGCKRLELVSATGHVAHVMRQHRLAARRYAIEPDWLNGRHLARALAEYAAADTIHVLSRYAWDSFVREGVPESKLQTIHVTTERRFSSEAIASAPQDDVFRIVYTGAVSVVKGIPVLLEAFSSLDQMRAELTLVGSTGSRGMRRFMADRCTRDARIRIAPGDPLPHLQRAHLYVHPSYQDGFGYAVGEALGCRVRAVVTADTGAKELITPGVNGDIIPTDDVDALRTAMSREYDVFRGRSSAPASRHSSPVVR
jgi:glycosyltransferase involved in cell wall biosynthesis